MSAAPPPPAPATPDSGVGSPREGHFKPRSRWWIVYSVIFGGGIFYYFALRYDDIRRAKHCLIVGIASLILSFGPLIAFGIADNLGLLE